MQITNFNELPIGKYLEILSISKDENLEELDKQIKIISILNDLTEDEILDLPLPDYKDMVIASRFLAEIPKDIKVSADEIHVGDWHLIATKDLTKLTTSQYVDFQTFSKDPEKYFVEILSCFLVPKGFKYCKDYSVAELQETLRWNLSVIDALALSAFFLTQLKDLILNSQSSLKEMIKDLPKEQREKIMSSLRSLERNGDG